MLMIFLQDLPDPNAQSLMPGFHLASATSAVVRAVPASPVLLDGHDLGFPTKVISVMKANWSTHIPLNALSTHALLASASSSKDDAYQNIAIGDGGLRIIPPKLNEKDEPSMSVHEWLHAHPRLVACIRKYLPHYGDEVANMWEKHFAAIFAWIDFFENFALYLQYDIFIRCQYVSNTSFNPAEWQTKMWSQIIDGARIKGFNSAIPLALPSSFTATSSSTTTSSFRSFPKGSAARLPSFPHRASGSSFRGPSRFRCIFCGNSSCINRACETTATKFITLINGLWQTATGEQVCFCWNGRGCTKPSCSRKHACSHCSGSHSAQDCSI